MAPRDKNTDEKSAVKKKEMYSYYYVKCIKIFIIMIKYVLSFPNIFIIYSSIYYLNVLFLKIQK